MPARESPLDGGGLGYLLVQAAQAWRNGVSAVLRDVAVTPAQFFVLVTLLRRARATTFPVSQREVAERIRMDPNTTSQIVRGLQRRGLLTRTPHPDDSRAVALALTDAGSTLTRDCAERVRALSTDFFSDVDHEVLHESLSDLLRTAGSR